MTTGDKLTVFGWCVRVAVFLGVLGFGLACAGTAVFSIWYHGSWPC